ncbi:hypothetical protein FTUN_2373 [Frigoriglobus tundricola]|uniref:Uncharacterized protein n=1 Tax=Frigoriglobus tundricola TaxID=2774151 RepID=A0A6M5YLE4_9BACT|nr:hypothetical protein FTUN_2373 [Frigoriglobus tundricola]
MYLPEAVARRNSPRTGLVKNRTKTGATLAGATIGTPRRHALVRAHNVPPVTRSTPLNNAEIASRSHISDSPGGGLTDSPVPGACSGFGAGASVR